MKFKTYLEQIQDVQVYPLISLVLFTAIFAGIVLYVFTADKKTMEDQANIPLN